MHFERFYDDVLAHVSYLVGDETSGVAAVVDPRRDVDVYLDAARARGLKVRHVVLTRTSSSFATGHIELRDRVGAEIVLSRRALVEFDARRATDGDEISLGPDVRLTFLEAPGTSDDGLGCVLQDRTRGPAPCCVFTGDTLPVDCVPRVDLAALDGRGAEELAQDLHATLQRKLLALPDATRIFPSRGMATWTPRSASPPSIATLGQQRATNPVLRLSLKAFVPVALQASHAAALPPYAEHVLGKNRSERPTLDAILEDVAPLDLEAVLAAVAKGSVLVDARTGLDWLLGHARGSLAVPLDGRFAPCVGTLVPATRPIVLVPPEGRALEAAVALSRLGLDSVWGYLHGGIVALRAARPDLVARTAALSPIELSLRRDARVVDVRGDAERELRRIPGALHLPLADVGRRSGEVKREQLVVLASERGTRAVTAASILERAGHERLATLMGGIAAWEDAGQPVERPIAQERRISA